MGRQLSINGLETDYKYYKQEFFPKVLEDPTVPTEDKENRFICVEEMQAIPALHEQLVEKTP
jgi:hypothetical protein